MTTPPSTTPSPAAPASTPSDSQAKQKLLAFASLIA